VRGVDLQRIAHRRIVARDCYTRVTIAVTQRSCARCTLASRTVHVARASTTTTGRATMHEFLRALATQRLDDHRFYHHSRINQSLHFVSALSFIWAYALVFTNPALAGIIGWCVSMVSRQAGHFFFEPRGYDEVNQVTDEYKERIKVGYNIRRKVVLMGTWAAIPLLLWVEPSLLGLIEPSTDPGGWVHDVGIAWLALGIAALLVRVVQLARLQDLRTGLVWVTKVLTDPFHDLRMYYRAPLALLRGELIDPMPHFRR
jgi:hypothetical protein